MAISETDFKYISDFVHQKAAIVLDASKGYLIESRLAPLAKRNGFATLEEMIAKLRAQPLNGLHSSVVEAMTTNETYFFRDIHPFETLQKVVLPALIKRRAAERQLNLWCAAASSGQEPYSIAMILRENFPELLGWKLIFLATDISKEMLARCREGCYSQLEINRGLPAPLALKYFQKIGTEWKVKDELRRMIEFKEMNLAQRWPALPPMDIIFMRNVLIYFDIETKKAIFARARQLLKPDGCLFLGSAETPMGVDDGFHRVAVDRSSYYIKSEAA
jgi:chemotaxis protein methyltransferase CheR